MALGGKDLCLTSYVCFLQNLEIDLIPVSDIKMAKDNRDTSMGGTGDVFQTTRWSSIRDVGTQDEKLRRIRIDNLISKYWKPVYCYLRRKGYGNEIAKDMTQGFFHEVVLGRNLFQQADQAKGRFRTFLLTALDRYVTSVHRKETAQKRSPKHGLIYLETEVLSNILPEQLQEAPEQVFNYAWASNLLDQVLTEVREEYCNTNMQIHWEVFLIKVLEPILNDVEAPPFSEICKKYNIESESRASNMIITVKRRFGVILKRCLRQFVESDSEVEDEYHQLIEILSKGSAG